MENARYWIGVVAADHIRRAVTEGVCAFSHGKQAAVAKLRQGDRLAFYSPKSGLGEGDTVQAFTAIGTVTGKATYQKCWAGTEFTAWVRDAAYFVEAKQAPVRPLLEPLSFVKSKRNWGLAFRRGQFEISSDDFALIARGMGVSPDG